MTTTPEEQNNDTLAEQYFSERMLQYGITDEINKVDLWQYNTEKKDNELVPLKVFSQSEKGIDIIVYSLDRTLITYKGDSRWSKGYKITRLHTPKITSKGKEQKYDIPRNAGTYPFFPPSLIEKYEKKEQIKTLVLTEGYFKAFKGAMHGFDIVGLSSITHYKDKDTGGLHSDILKLIQACGVENVIWLADGDANRISTKALEKGEDLYSRPNYFFSSCNAIRGMLADYDKIHTYFAYINSIDLEGMPKGLDDLLVAFPSKAQELCDDLLSVSKEAKYFWREEMTYSTGKIHRHFRLHQINEFVEYHSDMIRKIAKLQGLNERDITDLKNKEFVFCGTKYKWNEEKSICETVRPADAQKYFRVGDRYHEQIEIPNKYGDLEKCYHGRMKQTIIDDYGKEFVKHVPKYKAFCNVPDHCNYQSIITDCFNMYHPFEHEPEEGEFTHTLTFLRHIFGAGNIKCHHPEKKELNISELDLGLDYIQLLYQNPQQTLPILCLVSKQNMTGKTTFAKWLRLLFTQNVAIVGNAELANDFNASWAGKLLVICDEAKIDKQVVVERVKSLSTADKIFMNAKGKDHVEIDFFAKFLFLTNNEDNFIYASEEDKRYWVRKIPVIQDMFVGLLKEMKEEIPAFLNFMDKRKMKSENLDRAWFYPELIKTEALKKVVAFSRPTVEKELRQHLRDMFLDHGVSKILMSLDMIQDTFFRNKRFEKNYLKNVLEENLKVELYHTFIVNDVEYEILAEAQKAASEHQSEIVKRYKTKRYTFPKWDQVIHEGRSDMKRLLVNCNGRPYVFHIDRYLTKDEIEGRWVDPEAQHEADIMDSENDPKPWHITGTPAKTKISEDLPF